MVFLRLVTVVSIRDSDDTGEDFFGRDTTEVLRVFPAYLRHARNFRGLYADEAD
jgi:hypothetical protein